MSFAAIAIAGLCYLYTAYDLYFLKDNPAMSFVFLCYFLANIGLAIATNTGE